MSTTFRFAQTWTAYTRNCAAFALTCMATAAWAAPAIPNDALKWPDQCSKIEIAEADAAMDRMPKLTQEAMSQAQREAAARISSGPRGCIFGPFEVLLRSPELLTRAQLLGEYLRFHASIPIELRELAVLITGRFMESPYVWYIHEPIALRAGVSASIVDALANRRQPSDMNADQTIVYDVLNELHHEHNVSDATYTRARSRFGEQGIVDLVAIDSYFGLLAQELNLARTPLPVGVTSPFPAPRHR